MLRRYDDHPDGKLDVYEFAELIRDNACGVKAGGGSAVDGPLGELSLKLMLNAVSTYAMSARGLVFRNRMIATSPTNDKVP